MKYLVLLFVLFSGCSSKTTTTYVCFNPFMPIQSMYIDTDHPKVKDKGPKLELTTEDGDVIIIPKSLCAEVRKVAQ